MIVLWRPQPAEMATDLNLLVAPPEVQALVWRLAAVARGGRLAVRASPEVAVTALCGGAPWAVRALADAIERGLIEVVGETLALPWEWPRETTDPGAPRPADPPPPTSAALSPDTLRRLRWKFERRLDRWSPVPSSVTWGDVLEPASPWHGLLLGDGRRSGTPTGTVPGRKRDGTGTPTGTVPGRTGTPSPSDSPSDKNSKKQGEDAPPREEAPETGTRDGRDGTGTPTGTPVQSPKPPPSLTSPWSILVDAAAGAIDGITADATAAGLINATLRDKIDADPPQLTLDDVRGFGEALARDGARKHFPRIKDADANARDCLGWHRDCAPLLEALGKWRKAARKGATPSPAAPTPTRPKRAPRTPLTDAQKAALLPAGKDSAA